MDNYLKGNVMPNLHIDKSITNRKFLRFYFYMYLVYLALILLLFFAQIILTNEMDFPYQILVGGGLLIYAYYFNAFKLDFYGIENVQIVGAKLSEQWRNRIWEKGTLTYFEWVKANRMANK